MRRLSIIESLTLQLTVTSYKFVQSVYSWHRVNWTYLRKSVKLVQCTVEDQPSSQRLFQTQRRGRQLVDGLHHKQQKGFNHQYQLQYRLPQEPARCQRRQVSACFAPNLGFGKTRSARVFIVLQTPSRVARASTQRKPGCCETRERFHRRSCVKDITRGGKADDNVPSCGQYGWLLCVWRWCKRRRNYFIKPFICWNHVHEKYKTEKRHQAVRASQVKSEGLKDFTYTACLFIYRRRRRRIVAMSRLF